jgi:hypothetical protein
VRGGQNWDQIFSNRLIQFITKSTQNHNLNKMNYSMTKFSIKEVRFFGSTGNREILISNESLCNTDSSDI